MSACYGGTAALFNAVNALEAGAGNGDLAVVVAVDCINYAPGPARASGGCGAVAMLVHPCTGYDPRFIAQNFHNISADWDRWGRTRHLCSSAVGAPLSWTPVTTFTPLMAGSRALCTPSCATVPV